MPNQQVEATRQPARLTRIVEAGEVKEPLSKPILVAVAVFTSIGVWTDLRRPLPLRHSAFSTRHSAFSAGRPQRAIQAPSPSGLKYRPRKRSGGYFRAFLATLAPTAADRSISRALANESR